MTTAESFDTSNTNDSHRSALSTVLPVLVSAAIVLGILIGGGAVISMALGALADFMGGSGS